MIGVHTRVSGNTDQDGLLGVHLGAGKGGVHPDILGSGSESAAADLSLRNGGNTGSGGGREPPCPGHVHQRGASGGGGGSGDIVLGSGASSQMANCEDTTEHSPEDTSQLQHRCAALLLGDGLRQKFSVSRHGC